MSFQNSWKPAPASWCQELLIYKAVFGEKRLGFSTVGRSLARRGRGTAWQEHTLNEMCSLSSCSCRTDYSSAASHSRSMTREVRHLILLLLRPVHALIPSSPPCSRPHTFKLLTRRTLSEPLTPVPPFAAGFITGNRSWLSCSLAFCSPFPSSHPSFYLPARHEAPAPPPSSRLGTGVLLTSLLPPIRLFTSWRRALFLTCSLISVGSEWCRSTVLFIGPAFNVGWNRYWGCVVWVRFEAEC